MAAFVDNLCRQRNVCSYDQVTSVKSLDNLTVRNIKSRRDLNSLDEFRRRHAQRLVGDERQ